MLFLKMKMLFAILQWLLIVPSCSAAGTIEVTPGPGTFVHYENKIQVAVAQTGPDDQPFLLNSEIPITILRYNDIGFNYLVGGQPVNAGEMYLQLTSNCTESETELLLNISFEEEESFQQQVTAAINIAVGPPASSSSSQQDLDATTFLDPSSFSAVWSYTSFCFDPSSSANVAFRPFHLSLSLAVIAAIFALLVFAGPPPTGRQRSNIGVYSLVVGVLAILLVVNAKSENQDNNGRRGLEASSTTCAFNAEVLFDGCFHSLQVNAPAVRVLEVALNDQSSSNDVKCRSDYQATLLFPVLNNSGALLKYENNSTDIYLPSLREECNRPVEGRPFVDVTGNQLQASASIGNEVGAFWSAGALSAADTTRLATENVLVLDQKSSDDRGGNQTVSRSTILGSIWAKRALGEHASISSFAAFTIALMSNNAPPELVQEALMASLDEVRHAKTAFQVASLFLGQAVEPGPLPASSHQFGHNLTALALAAAREGCVDETLSALVIAFEAEEEESSGGDKSLHLYEGVLDEGAVASVKEKLRIIAREEARHASLAWRTVRWVCVTDTNACDVVQQQVFSSSKLDAAARKHSSADYMPYARLDREWRKIHSALVPFVLLVSDESKQNEQIDYCLQVASASDGEQMERRLTQQVVDDIIFGVLCSSEYDVSSK